jgi:hypothetical protein
VREHCLAGNTFTADDLTTDLTEWPQDEAGKTPAPRSVRSTITVFTGTYVKVDGLGRLGLLETRAEGAYRVPAVDAPPLWGLGYAPGEYWGFQVGLDITEGGIVCF